MSSALLARINAVLCLENLPLTNFSHSKTQEKQIPTYHLFIDFRQGYDTPNRDELYHAMNHFGIPSKLIILRQMTLQDTWSCVKAAGGVSEIFRL